MFTRFCPMLSASNMGKGAIALMHRARQATNHQGAHKHIRNEQTCRPTNMFACSGLRILVRACMDKLCSINFELYVRLRRVAQNCRDQ